MGPAGRRLCPPTSHQTPDATRLDAIKARLEQLGPKPAANAPPEGAEVSKARAETSQQSLRAQNAICAAERIKRKIEGKARLEVRKSH